MCLRSSFFKVLFFLERTRHVLTLVLAIYIKGASSYESDLLSCLTATLGTQVVFGAGSNGNIVPAQADSDPPVGPYIASVAGDAVTLGPVYRVQYDDHMAFMNGILPDGADGSFAYVPANTVSDSTVGVPVPSRLYSKYSQDESKPLKGIRVTVKDIIDVKGIKTSNGNRAWFKLYDAVNTSAPGIQKLLDLGADIIGKTKTAQFANSDRPTADWVDYQ
jgi:hypothetical protein